MEYTEAYKELDNIKSNDAKLLEAIYIAKNCIEMCDIMLPAWQKKDKPHDGQKVLVAFKSGSETVIDTAFYEKNEGFILRNWIMPNDSFIAWMKLPIPPTDKLSRSKVKEVMHL